MRFVTDYMIKKLVVVNCSYSVSVSIVVSFRRLSDALVLVLRVYVLVSVLRVAVLVLASAVTVLFTSLLRGRLAT
jgi:hypothetical protein